MSEYVYLIREREFCRLNEETYKIGKSKNIDNRMRQYPKNSELLLIEKVKNCDKIETLLINLFKINFQQRKEYGYEYFSGNSIEMRKLIKSIVYRDQFINNRSLFGENISNYYYILLFMVFIIFDRLYIYYTSDTIYNIIIYLLVLYNCKL